MRFRGDAARIRDRRLVGESGRSLLAPQSIVILLLLIAAACSDSSITGATPSDVALRNALVAEGFRADMIVDKGDYFLVEGDIKILKATINLDQSRSDSTRRPRPGVPSYQYSMNNLVSQSVVTAIRVDVSGAESSWQSAVRDAMAEWNQVTPGASVKFVEGAPAQITVTMVSNLGFIDCAHYIAAQGAPPSGGQPGTTIEINSPVTGCFDASQKKFVIAHELGHTIGFRHTNWAALGEPRDPAGANLIPGTPTTDNASIMNGNTGGSSWNGFSNYDKLAAFRLYPPPMPIVSVTYPGGVPTLSWTALPDGPQYRVTLSDYYSFWYEPAQDYESTSSSYPGDWTTGTSATSFGTYTGFSECHVGNREPGAYDQVDTFILEVRYPIADLDPTLVPAEVVSCQ